MIDVTEGYLDRWEKARKGEEAEAVGLRVMGEQLNDGALAFRYDPSDFVLTSFQRGAAQGDDKVIRQLRSMFFYHLGVEAERSFTKLGSDTTSCNH